MIDWTSWVPAMICAGTAIYTGGRLTEKVKSQGAEIVTIKQNQKEIDAKVGAHAVEIGELKAWRSGYEAAQAAHVGARRISE